MEEALIILIGGVLEPLLTRHEWEDFLKAIKNLLVEGASGLVAPSPNGWDDYCRKHNDFLPRSKRILEHCKLPEGRLGWAILMDREFNARIPAPYGESKPHKRGQTKKTQVLFDVLSNTKNSAAENFEDVVIGVVDGDLDESEIDLLIDRMQSNPVYL